MKPKIYRILKNDYLTLLTIIIPLALALSAWVLKIYGNSSSFKRGTAALSAEDAPFILGLSLFALVICAPICYYRIKQVKTIFENGEVVSGRVKTVWWIKDRGRMTYQYEHEEYSYQAIVGINKNKETAGYKEGYPLEIIVNKKDPSRSLIKKLYV